jgi:hypothetical protein
MEKLEVIATHKQTLKHYKTIISLSEWKSFKRNPAFYYHAYQLGFSQFNLSN